MTPEQLLHHHDIGLPWAAGQSVAADLPSAYRTALAVRALRRARGEIPRGYKIGFTNRRIWDRYGVFAPIWGTVWNTTIAWRDEDSHVGLARLCEPRIEPELVFGLRAAPAVEGGLDALFDALAWVAPGFEIVQSHRPGWKFSAADTVADSGLHARLFIGRKVAVRDLAPDAAGLHALLAAARLGLLRNGVPVEEGSGANVLDSPLQALAHFAAELHACPGAPGLAAGDVITTGTWTDAWPVHPGERWEAVFDGAPLSPLEISLR